MFYTSKLKKHNILWSIGFNQVENINSEILFNSIKDSLDRIYDRASNMVGAKTGIATRMNEMESHVHHHAQKLNTL